MEKLLKFVEFIFPVDAREDVLLAKAGLDLHDKYDHLLIQGAESIVPEMYKELKFIPPTPLGEVWAGEIAQVREWVKSGNEKEFNQTLDSPKLYFQLSQAVESQPDEETLELIPLDFLTEIREYQPDEEYLFGWYLDVWDFWIEYLEQNPDMPGKV